MKLEKYGVILKRLTETEIEMVREWRNDPKIAQFMEYKDYITQQMQQEWFAKINNNCNYYFIIEYKGQNIGLINIRDIDYEKKEGEGGIFIYNDDFLNSTLSFQASLCLTDFCFEELKLEKIIAHILQDNKRAIQYNKMLGFTKLPAQEKVLNQLYILEKENYIKSRNKIVHLLS